MAWSMASCTRTHVVSSASTVRPSPVDSCHSLATAALAMPLSMPRVFKAMRCAMGEKKSRR
eukprot:4830247-Lingulodinium_polyedra.AAC.1